MLASLNGVLVPQDEAKVPVTDRGFLYGDAVFETVAVNAGQPFRLDAHLDRLGGSMAALHFAAPCDKPALGAQVLRVIEANGLREGLARLCVTRGSGPRGLRIDGVAHPVVLVTAHASPPGVPGEGVGLVQARLRRIPPACLPARAKHANYLNGILAHLQAAEAGAYEAVLLTTDGLLAECCFSNLFLVRGGVLCTPDLSLGVLPGITRAAVIELARARGIEVEEGAFAAQTLSSADEVFLTNTGAGVVRVASIDGTALAAAAPVTDRLRADYLRLVQAETGVSSPTDPPTDPPTDRP